MTLAPEDKALMNIPTPRPEVLFSDEIIFKERLTYIKRMHNVAAF